MTDKEILNKLADKHGYSDKMGNVSGLFEHFELGYNAAQAEIARLKEAYLAEKREAAAFKERWNKDGVIIDKLKCEKQKLQSALDVAVEALGATWPNVFQEIYEHHQAALDKIKQIRGSK